MPKHGRKRRRSTAADQLRSQEEYTASLVNSTASPTYRQDQLLQSRSSFSMTPLSSSSKPLFELMANHQPFPTHQNRPKLALPRLHPRLPDGESTVSANLGRNRVLQACQACKTRKVKCSGERPRCKQCIRQDALCRYEDGKREKSKRYVCIQPNMLQTRLTYRHWWSA